jgi:MerR family transcriptional regulator, redox-sensitive transcriptional activator SoxR
MLEVKVDFKSSMFLKRDSDGRMKIGELARRAGLNPSAIRYYERVGVLHSPHRASGQRCYPAEALDRVLLVRFASEMGFTLPEIKLFLQGLRNDAPVGPLWRKFAQRKIIEVDNSIRRSRQLKSLLEHLLDCRCPSLQVCVRRLSLSPRLRRIRPRRKPLQE